MAAEEKSGNPLHMKDGDSIVTAWAQRAYGPGWGNRPVWVIVRNSAGVMRQECLQPHEQTAILHCLYNTCVSAHDALMTEVEAASKLSASERRKRK